MERNGYRDDPSSKGMQAEAAEGTPPERVQAVIADELGALVKEIRLLVRSIALLVMLIGVATLYMIATG